MSRSGVNLAVTKDGSSYNKLRRPDDVVTSIQCKSPPNETPSRAVSPSIEPSKRKCDEARLIDPASDDEPDRKRSRPRRSHEATPIQQERFEPRRVLRPVRECGMQSMFPGLDDQDSSDDATQEAMEYLRSVRSEASTIPNTLVAAPKAFEDGHDRSMYHNGRGDHRALYNDGTWVALDEDASELYNDYWSQDEDDINPEDEYYKSLLKRFNALRQNLIVANSQELARMGELSPSQYGKLRPPTNKNDWIHAIEHEFPTPVCVAQIDENNLFRALECCALALVRSDTISRKLSCWIWTLLALAGEAGTLDYQRVGRIRDLGHKAGQLSRRIRSGTMRKLANEDEDEGVEQWEPDGEDDGDDDSIQSSGSVNVAQPIPPLDTKKRAKGKQADALDRAGNSAGRSHEQAKPQDNFSSPRAEKEHGGATSEDGEVEDNESTEASGETDLEAARARLLAQFGDDSWSIGASGEADLETARARLLAQLGERLVQPSVPPPRGPRHRHNGKAHRDLSGRNRKSFNHKGESQAAGQNELHRSSSAASARNVPKSRAEAEALRQQLRGQDLRNAQGGAFDRVDDEQIASVNQDMQESRAEYQQSKKSAPAENDASVQHQDEFESLSPADDGRPVVDLNTSTTINMILTVVAQCYGQKDLLSFRSFRYD